MRPEERSDSNNPLYDGFGRRRSAGGPLSACLQPANIASIVIDEWDGEKNFTDSNIGLTRSARAHPPGTAAVNMSGTIQR